VSEYGRSANSDWTRNHTCRRLRETLSAAPRRKRKKKEGKKKKKKKREHPFQRLPGACFHALKPFVIPCGGGRKKKATFLGPGNSLFFGNYSPVPRPKGTRHGDGRTLISQGPSEKKEERKGPKTSTEQARSEL